MLMIWAWIDTSRAETGSSQTIGQGAQRERPRHADPLALTTGELVREPVVVLGVEPDHLHELLDASLAVGALGDAVDGERVPDDRPDPLARVERRVGSWKIIWISRRSARRPLPASFVTSWPSNSTVPSVTGNRRVITRARVDLPQPVSPTTPSVSPS